MHDLGVPFGLYPTSPPLPPFRPPWEMGLVAIPGIRGGWCRPDLRPPLRDRPAVTRGPACPALLDLAFEIGKLAGQMLLDGKLHFSTQ